MQNKSNRKKDRIMLGGAVLVLLVLLWPLYRRLSKPRGKIYVKEKAEEMIDEDVDPGRWDMIVIHHSGTNTGSMKAFDRFHREVKKWKKIGYHFVIGNGSQTPDGEVEVTERWLRQEMGAHAYGYNRGSIGICLVGNYNKSHPTEKQLSALRDLLVDLMIKFKIPAEKIHGHSDFCDTACPGKNFPLEEIKKQVRELVTVIRR